MKNITKVNKWIWITTIIIFLLTIATLILIFNYQITKNFNFKIIVKNDEKSEIIVANQNAMNLKINQNLVIKINDAFYQVKIKNIIPSDNYSILEFNNLPSEIQRLANVQIDAQVIEGKISLLQSIFGT